MLAGATPAALGLLADMSERFPTDRGAIMGLYSVFLAIGQIIGTLIGGVAADRLGIDGMFIATLVLLGIAVIPLARLRAQEHMLDRCTEPALQGDGVNRTCPDGRPWAPVPLARGHARSGRGAAPPRDGGRAVRSCAPAARRWTPRSRRTRCWASSCPAAAGSVATRSG